MPSLIETALAMLDGASPDEGIRLAASVFEDSLGRRDGLDLARLRDRLVGLVRSGATDEVVGAAVFALGKLHDPGLSPFFVEVVRDYLGRDPGVLYQALIALDNLDVDVFAGRDSMSVLHVDENRALAAAFLRGSGAGGRP